MPLASRQVDGLKALLLSNTKQHLFLRRYHEGILGEGGGAEGEKSFVRLFIPRTPRCLFAKELLIISFSPGRRIDVDVIFHPAGCGERVDSLGASLPSIGGGGRYSFFLSLFRSLCLYLFWVTRAVVRALSLTTSA